MASDGPKIAYLEPEMVAFGGPFVFLEGPLVATEEHKLASEKLKVASRRPKVAGGRLKWPHVAPRMTLQSPRWPLEGPCIISGVPNQEGGKEGILGPWRAIDSFRRVLVGLVTSPSGY